MIVVQKQQGLVTLQQDEFLDPEFLTLQSLSVQEALYCPPEIVTEKLAHRITQKPTDLRSHVQRIFIFSTQADTSRTFSALVDLFLALGKSGYALRKRLLQLSKPYLFDEQYHSLQSSLNNGVVDETDLPQAEQSLLRKGKKNNQAFIVKRDQNKADEVTVMEQVQSYIEFGQIEQAKALLQQTIIDTAGDDAYFEQLLEIFQKTEDKGGFAYFYQQLQHNRITIPDAWQQFKREFT